MKDETHLLDCNITPTLSEHLNSPPVFSDVRGVRSLVFCVMFVRPLCWCFLGDFWLLRCLSFFVLQLLIAPVVS